MLNEHGPKGQEYIDWEKVRQTPDYINSLRSVLNQRINNREVASKIFTSIFSPKDAEKFIKENNLTITFDELLNAADENYKNYLKTGQLYPDTQLN